MKLTGERPMQGATPDSLLAFHDAGYREVVARLGAGVVVDIGCGVGDETLRLVRADRFVVGADYSAETMQLAAADHEDDAGLRFCAFDGAALALRDASVDFIVSSHIIEHFTNPVSHVADLARALRPDGTAFVITPNAPADFENPFHVYLFDPAQLISLLSLFFEDVVCLGLEGDESLRADFAARRSGSTCCSSGSVFPAVSTFGYTSGYFRSSIACSAPNALESARVFRRTTSSSTNT
jgi:SAM-dependent methyltransferase